jgi:hypothetical protein
LKKNYFSPHKLPKQQSTRFWSQGILGVKVAKLNVNGKLDSMVIGPASFKKSTNILYLQHPVQKCKRYFGCLCPLRVKIAKKNSKKN